MQTSQLDPVINPRRIPAMSAFRNLLSRLFVASGLWWVLCGMVTTATAQKTIPNYGKLPLSFEANRGQADNRIQFLSRGQGYQLGLSPNEAVLQLQPTVTQAGEATMRMRLLGGNPKATAQAEDKLPGTVNYFEGSDPKMWKTGIPTYQRVSYKAVYPGVDLVYYGNQRQLEYDFVVAPGADPSQIGLGFTGASPRINSKTGDLVLAVNDGETRFHAPVVYQRDGSRRVPVEGSYLLADGQVRFKLGAYDHTRELVIDPILSYMTYLGGTNDDQIHGMAVDSSGNVIVVGTTYSADFPLKSAYNSTALQYNGNYPHTMFVSKFNATGTALVYSTYLGQSTAGAAVAVDPSGNAYAFATTDDPNYPVTAGAYQTICGANYNTSTGARITGCSATSASGNNSTAITKITPDGQTLVYSTYLSGSNGNQARAIAVNSAGEAYVTGTTNFSCTSPSAPAYYCFPQTAAAADPSKGSGDTEGFFTKLNAQGTGLVYSTVIANHDPAPLYVSQVTPTSIALDAAGNAYITGQMDSNYRIITTTGAFKPAPPANGLPAFVAKYNPAGTAATSLVYSTYLSGTLASTDIATGIAVDASGNAFVTGHTNSCTFPTTKGAFSTVPGGLVSQNQCSGGFLSKLNSSGSALVWSTYTGNQGANGYNNDNNDATALGPDGSPYVVGDQQGPSLSPTVNPILTQSESHFTYIKHFSADGSAVVFSSAVGGTTDTVSIPAAVALDSSGNIYLAGYTLSPTWPTTTGAFQAANKKPNGGTYTGYVVKIAPTATTTTALTLPTGTVTAGQSVKFSAKVTGQTGNTGTPTGTVTFLSGSTTLGTGTLDSTGNATYTATSLNATTYSVTASYGGDTAFAASVSAAQNLVVTPATPTITLTAPANALVGASFTLGVTVTGTGGTPTGTITFKDGTTTLGTATLAAGAASYSTSTLAAGAHTITASYGGDSLFAAAVSSASTININVPAAISFAALPTSLTIVHGASGSVVITGTPVGGYTGTVSFACGTLPTAATCTFAPASLSLTGNNTQQSTTLTISTVTTAALELPVFGRPTPGIYAAVLFLPLGFLLRNRRRHLLKGTLLLIVMAASVSVLGITGCGGGSNSSKTPATITTPAGSYSVAVTVTAASGNTTVKIPITVQ